MSSSDGIWNLTTFTTDGKGETVKVAPSEKIYLYKSEVTTGENKMFKSVVKTFTAPARKEIGEVKIDFNTETIILLHLCSIAHTTKQSGQIAPTQICQ